MCYTNRDYRREEQARRERQEELRRQRDEESRKAQKKHADRDRDRVLAKS